jgi:quinoprotein glucose dehydrogenase
MIVGNSWWSQHGVRSPDCAGNAAGHVQAFRRRDGAPKWIFHTVPRGNEPGVETWERVVEVLGNTKRVAAVQRGSRAGARVHPVGTPTNDYFGGDRQGNNLYAESLLAIAADSGKLVCISRVCTTACGITTFRRSNARRYQSGRPAHQGRRTGQQARLHVRVRACDRQAGVAYRRAAGAAVAVPGEKTSATQPFPTKPPPFARQGLTPDDLIDFTPELRAEALQIVADYTLGPIFTPPSVVGENGKKACCRCRALRAAPTGAARASILKRVICFCSRRTSCRSPRW